MQLIFNWTFYLQNVNKKNQWQFLGTLTIVTDALMDIIIFTMNHIYMYDSCTPIYM
jgi:hypothetical protein